MRLDIQKLLLSILLIGGRSDHLKSTQMYLYLTRPTHHLLHIVYLFAKVHVVEVVSILMRVVSNLKVAVFQQMIMK